MLKSLVVLAVFGAMSGPAGAEPMPQPQAPEAAKPQTVKKVVCRRVDDEETTGSRLASAPKVCKTIEVPAPSNGAGSNTRAPASERD